METSFTSRRQATQPVPQFAISLPPPAEIPSTRYPNHAPAIFSPRYNDSHVGPRGATAAASTAATPTSSSSHAVLPSSPPIAQPPSSSLSIASSNTNRTSSFPPLFSSTSRETTTTNSSILTPKPGIAPDGLGSSPVSSSGSSQTSQPGGGGGIYYPPNANSWQQSGSAHTPSYTYASATNHNSTSSSNSAMPQSFSSRQPFYGGVSPSVPQFPARNSTSSPNGDNIPNPPNYQESSPFSTPISAGGGSLGSSYSQAPGAATHPALSQSILSSQNSNSAQPPTSTQQGGNSGPGQPGHEGPSYRAPPTPNSYFPASSNPQQTSFPSFTGPPQHSPTTHSPTTTGVPSRGLNAVSSGMAPPLPYGPRMHPVGSYHSPYQMPGGPVLSNVHHPGAPLSMVGGIHGVHHHYGFQHGHHLYGGHNGPPSAERPFKCDECPQSFNRNHDLKRHKRIHLAVKPFPCTHCDKSFSRKDALKVSSPTPQTATLGMVGLEHTTVLVLRSGAQVS